MSNEEPEQPSQNQIKNFSQYFEKQRNPYGDKDDS